MNDRNTIEGAALQQRVRTFCRERCPPESPPAPMRGGQCNNALARWCLPLVSGGRACKHFAGRLGRNIRTQHPGGAYTPVNTPVIVLCMCVCVCRAYVCVRVGGHGKGTASRMQQKMHVAVAVAVAVYCGEPSWLWSGLCDMPRRNRPHAQPRRRCDPAVERHCFRTRKPAFSCGAAANAAKGRERDETEEMRGSPPPSSFWSHAPRGIDATRAVVPRGQRRCELAPGRSLNRHARHRQCLSLLDLSWGAFVASSPRSSMVLVSHGVQHHGWWTGSIVNISSTTARGAYSPASSYGPSKVPH